MMLGKKVQHYRFFQFIVTSLFVMVPIIAGMCTARLLTDVNRPFAGIFTYNNTILGRHQLSEETPSWWYVVQDKVLPPGAGIFEVNGYSYSQAANVFAESWAAGHTDVLLLHDLKNDFVRTAVPLTLFTFWHFIDVKLPGLIVAISLWLTAILIHRAPSNDPIKFPLVLSTLLGALQIGLDQPALFFGEDLSARLLELLSHVTTSFLSAALIAIGCALIPSCWRSVKTFILLFSMGWACITVALLVRARILYWSLGMDALAMRADDQAHYTLYQFLAAATCFLIMCLGSYIIFGKRTVANFRQKRVAIALLLAFLIALPALFQNFAFRVYIQPGGTLFENLDVRFLMILIPLFPVLTILRYQSFRVSSPILTLVILMLLSGISASVMNAFYFHLAPATAERATPISFFAPGFVVIFIVSATWIYQWSIRGWFGGLYHRRRRNDQDAQYFFDSLLKDNLMIDHLLEGAVKIMARQLQLDYAAVWTVNHQHMSFPTSGTVMILTAQFGDPIAHLPTQVTVSIDERNDLLAHNLYYCHHSSTSLPKSLNFLCEHALIELVLPLRFMNELIAVVALGRQSDHDIFVEHDIEVVIQMTQQIVLYMQFIRHASELKHTHYRLHDTTQQFFIIMQRELQQMLSEAPSIYRSLLLDWEAGLSEQIGILRDIQNGKYQKTLRDVPILLNNFRKQHDLDITAHIDMTLDMSEELEDEFYHWMHEGLINIVKHANAKHVSVTIESVNNIINLVILDDGNGLLSHQESELLHGRTGAIERISRQVSEWHGELNVTSQPERGTSFTVTIPLEAARSATMMP